MNAIVDAAFNYSSLPIDKAASARAAAERIRGRMQLAAESIIEVGRELIEQKKALGHGNFLPWIEAEFGMSDRTARRFISVANNMSGKLASLSNLGREAIYALAAPETPPEVREQVEERASKGEKVTAAEVERLKKQLAKAKQEAEEKEEQRQAQEHRANIAVRQVDSATNRAMYAEADKQRLADEIAALQDEISRLNEDGVIHVQPATQPGPTTIAVQTPIPSLLLQVFDKSSDVEIEELLLMRRARIMSIEERASQAA